MTTAAKRMMTVTGMVASKSGLTLYREDGTSEEFPSRGFRTQAILDAIMPALSNRKKAKINLADFEIAAKIAKASGGAVKLTKGKNGGTVTTGKGKTIPASALGNQIERAAWNPAAAKGFALFMKDFDSCKREHSAKELLEFLTSLNLPLADDGKIIAYKRLSRQNGKLVDCHTKSIVQRVGSRVSMNDKDVDANRRTSCSTGFHIAHQKYLPSFGGEALTLVKIRAQDCIAVPHGEHKMRVAAYHIVAEIENGNNIDVNSPKIREIIANVVAGRHPGIIEEVRVSKGGAFKTEVLGKALKPRQAATPRSKTLALAPEIDVKAIKAKAVVLKKATPVDVSPPSVPRKKLGTAKIPAFEPLPKVAAPHRGSLLPPATLPKVTINSAEHRAKEFAAILPKLKPDYIKKMVDAERLHKLGESMRDIAKAVGLDRESMMNNLRKVGVLPAAA